LKTWTTRDLVARLASRAIQISPVDDFAVGRTSTHAVRICLGSPAGRGQPVEGLAPIAEVLDQPPEPCCAVV